MGLGYSKTTHKLTKVAPMQTHGNHSTACLADSGMLETRIARSLDVQQIQSSYERQLPPLRETLHGRCSAVPRPISFDIQLGNEETSIIKRHPPRRLQRLEPVDLPTILASEKLLNKADQTAKGLDSSAQPAKHMPRRRQHLHKMQMLELNQKRQEMKQLQAQAELRRKIHRDARINKQKMRELKARKVRENVHRNNVEDGFITVEHDDTFNLHHGSPWNGDTSEQCDTPEFYRSENSKLELWLMKHRPGNEIICDSSSDESQDSWGRDDKKIHHRPPLTRTKTERIPTFDEFFDQDV
ncbi:factor associated with metabolism and energy [Lissotriton helveticus]